MIQMTCKCSAKSTKPCTRSPSGSGGGGGAALEYVANTLHSWPFNGDANDADGGQDLTNVNGITYTTGHNGQAASFDDTNRRFESPTDWTRDAGLATKGAVGFWAKQNAGDDTHVLNDILGGGATTGPHVRLYQPAGRCYLFLDSSNYYYFDTAATTDWVHWVVRWDCLGGTSQIFRNGVAVTMLGSPTIPASFSLGLGKMIVGNWQGAHSHLNGLLDGLRIVSDITNDGVAEWYTAEGGV